MCLADLFPGVHLWASLCVHTCASHVAVPQTLLDGALKLLHVKNYAYVALRLCGTVLTWHIFLEVPHLLGFCYNFSMLEIEPGPLHTLVIHSIIKLHPHPLRVCVFVCVYAETSSSLTKLPWLTLNLQSSCLRL